MVKDLFRGRGWSTEIQISLRSYLRKIQISVKHCYDKEQAIRQLEKKSTSNIDRFSSYSVLSVPLESVIVF